MSIIKVDELIKNFAKERDEVKRLALGKYSSPGSNFSLEEKIFIYTGKDICHNKFNFLVDGNKCFMCNSLSFLYSEGEITNNSIVIETGKYKGKKIQTLKYDKRDSKFGQTNQIKEVIPKTYVKNINENIESRNSDLVMKNFSCDESYFCLFSSIEDAYAGIKNLYLGAYVCKEINIIKFVPEKLTDVTSEHVVKLLKTVYDYYMDGKYCHGEPDLKYLHYFNGKFVLEPTKYSAITADSYSKKKIRFVGPSSFEDQEINVPTESIIVPEYVNKYETNIPCIKSYLNNRSIIVRPSNELFEFTRKYGINFFKSMEFYMWIVLLLSRNDFFHFITRDHMQLLKSIFIESELKVILSKLPVSDFGYDGKGEELCKKLNFAMKPDILNILKENSLFKKEEKQERK